MGVRDTWSTTAGSNTAVGGINIGEGNDPGNLNDADREMMAEIAAVIGPGTQRTCAGTAVGTTDGSGQLTITFPASFFTVAPTVVVCNGDSNNGPSDLFTVVLATVTTSGCTAKVYTTAGSPAASLARRVNWVATGA